MVVPFNPFEFATAGRIVVRSGAVAEAGAAARSFGRRALIVTGRSRERAERLSRILAAEDVVSVLLSIEGEPSVATVVDAVRTAREQEAELVVAIGGGSAIDAAKAVAALAPNPGDVFDYLEVIGRGQPLVRPALPVIAIPTTAGTGSEVTRNAVLASPEHRVKVSLRSASMLPRVALVDPELSLGLPAGLTATTGLDALTQLIEPYVSSRANPMVDALAAEGIRRAAAALPRAWRHGTDIEARTDMALASLWSGMALANAGLGAVHGLAGPIGGMFAAPHGAICAALLPHVMASNIAALRASGATKALARFDDVACLLTGRPAAGAEDGVAWVRDLVRQLEVAPLRSYGLSSSHVPGILGPARRASSMKGNPIDLSDDELTAILRAAI